MLDYLVGGFIIALCIFGLVCVRIYNNGGDDE